MSAGVDASCGTVTKCESGGVPPQPAATAPSLRGVTVTGVWPAPPGAARGQMGAGSYRHRVLGIIFLLLHLKRRAGPTTTTAGQGRISAGIRRPCSIEMPLRTSHHAQNRGAEELCVLWPPASDSSMGLVGASGTPSRVQQAVAA